MNIFAWIVLSYLAIQVIASVLQVGKARKPKTPTEAVCDLIELAVLAWVVVLAVTA